jgi:hypothetical protein
MLAEAIGFDSMIVLRGFIQPISLAGSGMMHG